MFFALNSQEKMFGADVDLAKTLRFLSGKIENALAFLAQGHLRRRGNAFPNRDVRFDFLADRSDVQTQYRLFAQGSQQEVLGLNAPASYWLAS
jgi:hypothetical protein